MISKRFMSTVCVFAAVRAGALEVPRHGDRDATRVCTFEFSKHCLSVLHLCGEYGVPRLSLLVLLMVSEQNTSKEMLAKQIRFREEHEAAEHARRSLQLLRETEQARECCSCLLYCVISDSRELTQAYSILVLSFLELERESENKSKNARQLQEDATRDYKRRRPTYRGKGSGVKSVQMVLREVLEKQMLGLSMETGWNLVTGGDGDEVVGHINRSSQRTSTYQNASRTSVTEWMSLTDALHVRDMARRETDNRSSKPGNQEKRARSRSRSVSSSSRSKRHRSSRQSQHVRRSSSRFRSRDRRERERERSSRPRRSWSRSPSPHHRHRHQSEDSRSSRSRRH